MTFPIVIQTPYVRRLEVRGYSDGTAHLTVIETDGEPTYPEDKSETYLPAEHARALRDALTEAIGDAPAEPLAAWERELLAAVEAPFVEATADVLKEGDRVRVILEGTVENEADDDGDVFVRFVGEEGGSYFGSPTRPAVFEMVEEAPAPEPTYKVGDVVLDGAGDRGIVVDHDPVTGKFTVYDPLARRPFEWHVYELEAATS